MLPGLLKLTLEPSGCKRLMKQNGLKPVVAYVSEVSRTSIDGQLRGGVKDHLDLINAADVILNVFANRKQAKLVLDAFDFVPLLAAMVSWSSVKGADNRQTYKILGMSACLIASVLELTTEEALKKRLDLASYKRLPKSMEVLIRFLEFGHRHSTSFSSETELKEMWEITITSCCACIPVWPQLKKAITKSEYWTRVSRGKQVSKERLKQVCKEEMLRKLLELVAFT
eukprot:TRINITY_DN2542_c0_g2_i1.p1 TRINITY_DN2542_c0_g2~~TRINITY_DN2542_c0_g2_i1.p1  ORF type:complete len:227 (+),score=77.65 TRINITY_DN2542_c0_g2_i1:2-682(+)